METLPHSSRDRDHHASVVRVPRPRRSRHDQPRAVVDFGRVPAGEPDAPPDVAARRPRRPIREPALVRTGAKAVLGMLLMAAVLGGVGGFALLWLGTHLVVALR